MAYGVELGKMKITSEGGIAIKLTNKTGGVSIKGTLAHVYTGSDLAFDLMPLDAPDIIGVVYDSGVADGAECWVVVSGMADVYFVNAATRDHYARSCVTADAGAAVGYAFNEAAPTSPFATDKHFQEIGHVLQTTGGAGLARCVLHFN